jgi:hypothetical protein
MVALIGQDESSGDCRKAPREQVCMAGRLVTTWQRYGFSVEVCDVSLFGARIRVGSVQQLPPTFELWLDGLGIVHPCRIAWRRNGEIGVEFTGHPSRATTKVQSGFRHFADDGAPQSPRLESDPNQL